jgi:hypothetical protein
MNFTINKERNQINLYLKFRMKNINVLKNKIFSDSQNIASN